MSLMKIRFIRLLSFILIVGILLQNFSKLVLFINYQFNQSAITEAYCINKDKPSMHCNGQCHLLKQLKAADKKENHPSALLKENVILLFSENQLMHQLFNPSIEFMFHLYSEASLQSSHLLSIFHPPCC